MRRRLIIFPALLLFSLWQFSSCLKAECGLADPTCSPTTFFAAFLAGPGSVASTVCSLSPLEIIQPENWPQVQTYLKSLEAQGTVAAPSVSVIGTAENQANSRFGAVVHPNGKIYAIPSFNATTVLEFDPATSAFRTFGAVGIGSLRWLGGAVAPDGRIFSPNNNGTNLLVIDPASSTTSFITNPVQGRMGAALATNGKIYAAPFGFQTILEIDPATDSVTAIGSAYGTAAYKSIVAGPNGLLYLIPYNATNVIEFDPATLTATIIGSNLGAATAKWMGAVVASDGLIYGIPETDGNLLVIDPVNKTTTLKPVGVNAQASGALAASGVLFGAPKGSANILNINPITAAEGTLATGASAWEGMTSGPDSKLYSFYNNSTPGVLVVDSGSAGRLCPAVLASSYFNPL